MGPGEQEEVGSIASDGPSKGERRRVATECVIRSHSGRIVSYVSVQRRLMSAVVEFGYPKDAIELRGGAKRRRRSRKSDISIQGVNDVSADARNNSKLGSRDRCYAHCEQ